MLARTVRPSEPGRCFAGLIVLALLVGCDIPTELPAVDTRWVVPAEETRFGVADLVPGSVTLTPDESAFVVDFGPVTFSESLGSLCAAQLRPPSSGARRDRHGHRHGHG